MKQFNKIWFIVSFFILEFIIFIQASEVKIDDADKFYMIFVKTDYNERNHSKRQVSNSVYNLIYDIHNLIMNNINTFKDPSKIFEIEENNKLRKRNDEVIYLMDHGESDIVYPISSHKDRTIVYAYLSEKLAKTVESYPDVMAVIPDQKITFNTIKTLQEQEQKQEYQEQEYQEQEYQERIIKVKNETNWEGVSIRENADLHLSLISQGKYDKALNITYDTNYYYPSSAGQDIDIYVIDTGFNFRHPEFSNKDEREAKCLYYINKGGLLKPPHEDYCYSKVNYIHGSITSDTVAGLTHGVANKANVYGIVIDEWASDLFVVLQYLTDNNILRKNKSVVNLSIGFYLDNEEHKELIDFWKGLIDTAANKGAIIVGAAGNAGEDIESITNITIYPCAFDNVICVGAIDNYGFKEYLNNIESGESIAKPKKLMKMKYYRNPIFLIMEKN